MDEQSPWGRLTVAVFGFVGAVTLKDVAIYVAIFSGCVSIVAGILASLVYVRKLRSKRDD